MKVIITGGTGLIGRPLARQLAANGHKVTILSRHPEQAAALFPDDIQVAAWNLHSSEGWGALLEGSDAVINLAGESIAGKGLLPSRWSAARKKRIRESRVQAGKVLVEAMTASSHKAKVFIQASAVGYYGQRTDDLLLDESSPAGNDFLAQVCQAWEDSTAAIESMGIRRVIIRTGVVLTREGGAFPLMVLPFRFFAGGPLGSGRQWLSWIHRQDEVEGIRFLLENENAHGPFNLVAPTPLTNKEFAQHLGRILHRPAFVPTPALILRLALGEIATLVLDGQRVIPRKLLDLGYSFKYADIDDALGDLLE